jgi:predicted nucleic acid-binding protein
VRQISPLWEKAYELAFQLRRKGVTIPYTDILIAATALAHEATLLHVDAHFDLAAQFSSLKVESYVGKI